MINYNKNKLIDKTLETYYRTFACTLDTADYVPEKYNNKILKYIFKNLKKTFRKIDKEDNVYQVKLKRAERLKKKQAELQEKKKKALERKKRREAKRKKFKQLRKAKRHKLRKRSKKQNVKNT